MNAAFPATRAVNWALSGLIAVLALADGFLHLMLDFVLFHGRFWGSNMPGPPPGPPPGAAGGPPAPPPGGAPPQLPLPLNELFVLNAIGYVVLVLLFVFGRRWLGEWRWLLDVAMIVYAAASIAGWLYVGAPNPNGLGYLSKALEVALIVLLIIHAWVILRRPEAERLSPGSAQAR